MSWWDMECGSSASSTRALNYWTVSPTLYWGFYLSYWMFFPALFIWDVHHYLFLYWIHFSCPELSCLFQPVTCIFWANLEFITALFKSIRLFVSSLKVPTSAFWTTVSWVLSKFLFSPSILSLFMCVNVLPTYCVPHTCNDTRGQKRAPHLLEQALQRIVSHHVG